MTNRSFRQMHTRPPRQRRSPHNVNLAMSGILALVVVLLLAGSARWFLERGYVFGPTPTVTPTKRSATDTPTVDFRATANVENLATQRAQEMALLGMNTPTPQPTATPTPEPTATATLAGLPAPSQTAGATVMIPIVGNLFPTTDTPTPVPTVTPTYTSESTVVISVPTVPQPAETSPIATPALTETPTTTVTETPAAVDPNSPTPTPAVQPTVTLRAVIVRDAAIRMGPSSLYTQTTVLGNGQVVSLYGRSVSGEWVYVCCAPNNVEGWTRQANLNIEGNPTPVGAPPNTNANDPRHLLERQPTVALATPLARPTPIPPGDYPLFRRDPAAQANLGQPLAPTYRFEWAGGASRAMSSPVIVVGASAMVASEDLHLYSFNKESGSQRWRYQFAQLIRQAPAIQDNLIYVVDNAGMISVLQEQGNGASLIWTTSIGTAPAAAPTLWGNFLFVAGNNNRLYAFDRVNRAELWSVDVPGPALRYPAVGDQLIYVANNSLRALDIYNKGNLVWEDTRFFSVSAPPVYSQPGVVALAEVYAADAGGNIYALDANTGDLLWSHTSNETTEAMAIDRSTLYAVGNGFVKAIDRRNGTLLWSYPFGDRIVGGPIVGEGRLIFVSESGAIQVLDALNGRLLFNNSISSRVAGAPAVSNRRIFVPGVDGNLHAWIGGN